MKMNENFDVIVIGAGPAGSVLAEKTADAGLKTLILEKEKLPMDKPCAGIIPPRVYRLIPEIPNDVVERNFKGYHVFSPSGIDLQSEFLREGVIVDRKKFDFMLTGRAKDSGASVIEGSEVKGIEISDKLKVITENGREYYSEFLAGADGANSIVRKSIAQEYKNFALGVQYTFNLSNEVIEEKTGDWFEVYYGLLNYGYGWVSPLNNKIKIGLGGTDNKFMKNSKEYLNKFVENFKKKKEIKNLETINFESHRIPADGPVNKPCRGNAVLIGDAGGFVNPLTGEGIYYAIKSAHLAADAITSCKGDFEKECTEKLKNIKLNTKLRDEVLQNPDAMEEYVRRLKNLE
jgi:geranylgeranyl reductase family protein